LGGKKKKKNPGDRGKTSHFPPKGDREEKGQAQVGEKIHPLKNTRDRARETKQKGKGCRQSPQKGANRIRRKHVLIKKNKRKGDDMGGEVGF